MSNRAGEVHSIRLPAGTAKELFELTGMRVSTAARQQILAIIQRAKLEKSKQEQG